MTSSNLSLALGDNGDIAFEQWNKFAADLCKSPSPASFGLQSAHRCVVAVACALRAAPAAPCALAAPPPQPAGVSYCAVICPKTTRSKRYKTAIHSAVNILVMNEAAHAQHRTTTDAAADVDSGCCVL